MKKFKAISYNNISFYAWDPRFYYPYCLVGYTDFTPTMLKKYPSIIVDCQIGLLNKEGNDYEYPFLNEWEEKAKKYGSENCNFVIPDYPITIIPEDLWPEYQDLFLKKTERNIKKWKDIPNTILSIQYEFANFESFKEYWNESYNLSKKWIGIGNLRKLKNSNKHKRFFKKVVNYLIKNNIGNKRIHFFGIGLPFIDILFNNNHFGFNISFDNAKWTLCDPKRDKILDKKRKELGKEKHRYCSNSLVSAFFGAYHRLLTSKINHYKNNEKITEWMID